VPRASKTTPTRKRPNPVGWKNRIVSFDPAVQPEQLLANPQNWRIHPLGQRAVLEGALDQLGWIQAVIVNTTTSHVVDGHARIESAITKGEPVPVIYVELSEDEEKAALATFDAIGALAATDQSKLDDLLRDVKETHGGLADLLADAQALDGAHRPAADATPGDNYSSSNPSTSEQSGASQAVCPHCGGTLGAS
jgi:hypothetical protein